MKILRFLTIALLMGAMGVCTAAPLTPDQVTQVQQITRDYLLNNPQILIEMSRKLQTQQQEKALTIAKKLIKNNEKALFSETDDPVIGNPKGNVTMVEFFDYQCPHCKTMGPVIDKLITSDSQLRVVFKLLPIFGSNSVYAAKAAYAAQKQGKYFALHKALLASKPPLTKEKVLQIAKSAGLDVTKLKTDMKDKAYDKKLKDTFKLAQNILQPAMGIIATPAYIIANRAGTKFGFVPGQVPMASLQKQIQAVR